MAHTDFQGETCDKMPGHPLDCFCEGLWSMALPGTWLPWAEVCTLATGSDRYWTPEKCQNAAEQLSGLDLVELDPEPPQQPRRVRLVPGYGGALELSDSEGEAGCSLMVAKEAGAEEVKDTGCQTPSTERPADASSSSEQWTASGRRWRSQALAPPPGSWVLPQTSQVPQEQLEPHCYQPASQTSLSWPLW